MDLNQAPPPPSHKPLLDSAAEWLTGSGIQEPSGGVARYYRADLEKNAPVSTEITGYAASALLYLYTRTGRGECLEPALRAGRFLTRAAWDDAIEVFPFEIVPGEKRAYFFDSGIIARGLLALSRARRDGEFLATAQGCAVSMARDFAAGCDYHPILLLPSKAPAPRGEGWSRRPGCYQLKAALAWHELTEDGHAELSSHYELVLAYALADAASFLALETDQERLMDRLHAYCYFLEGLLPAAGRPECAAALREGIARVADSLRRVAPVFARSDVYAQLLRVRLYADALDAAPLDRAAAEEEAAALPPFQAGGRDARVRGGFFFGRRRGELTPYVNPVSTAFAAQALQMWHEYRAGGFDPDWRMLI